MVVASHKLSTAGRGERALRNTIQLPRPTSVVAEITLSSFDTFGDDTACFAVFDGCTTDGSDGPPSETFAPPFQTVLIRNGLTSVTYSIEIANCTAFFFVNVFFWPRVNRG